MNPVAINFALFFLITAFLSRENRRRRRCFTSLEPSLTSILCLANSLGIPDMSVGFQTIVPKKVGEREFLFCREVGTDGHRFGGITSTLVDLLHVGFFWRSENARLLGWDL
jgi:hypothetical protein